MFEMYWLDIVGLAPHAQWKGRRNDSEGKNSMEAMEDYLSPSKKFWQAVRHPRREKQCSTNSVRAGRC